MLSAPVALGPLLIVVAVLLWPGRSAGRAIMAITHRTTPSPEAPAAASRTHRGHVLGQARRLLPRAWRGSSARIGDAEVLALLDALSPALRAGLTPGEALRAATTTAAGGDFIETLAPVTRAAAEGRSTGAAWERVAERTGHPDLATLARAWSVSERLGCALSQAVAQTARSCRDRTQAQQRLASATAGTRATSTLLTLLPIGGVGVAPMLGLDPLRLYGTPVALACLIAGAMLILLGRGIVQWMIRRVEVGLG